VEFRPRQEGNTLHAILAPKKDVATAKKEAAAAAKKEVKKKEEPKQAAAAAPQGQMQAKQA
jgi:hypothetical protein